MNFILVLLILLHIVSFNNSDSKEYANKLHCYYSKYMLYYFKLTGMIFYNTFKGLPDSLTCDIDGMNIDINDIDTYDEQLRSHGNIILFMLQNLKDTAPNLNPPDDLMIINLYLNRIQGDTKIDVCKRPLLKEQVIQRRYIMGYRINYVKIMSLLLNSITNSGCGIGENSMLRDRNQTDTKLQEINNLLANRYPLVKENNIQLFMKLGNNKKLMEQIFQSTIQEGSYVHFHPDNLLFKVLMNYKNDTESSEDESIDLHTGDAKYTSDKTLKIRDVLTNYNLPNGANATIYDLFMHVNTIFDQIYVISFQRHVLAAVLYPVFMCLSTYLMFIKVLLFPEDIKIGNVERRAEIYEKLLKNKGTILLGQILYLIEYQIFPNSVEEYLQKMIAEIDNFVSIPEKETRRYIPDIVMINQLLNMCSEPMELYNIQYKIDMERFDLSDEQKLKNFYDTFKIQINDVDLYVKSLEKLINVFKSVLKIYDHENMFNEKPLYILSKI